MIIYDTSIMANIMVKRKKLVKVLRFLQFVTQNVGGAGALCSKIQVKQVCTEEGVRDPIQEGLGSCVEGVDWCRGHVQSSTPCEQTDTHD